ncbi:MAG: magnesium and cobalt transport protein CorA [Crocinitomicaceae bacterium]|jgi:magnesium transporter|nr:magnesium and cobalt transport protein CorA [Crocinitomicaceae bacterium]
MNHEHPDISLSCQLYDYNNDEYKLTRNSPKHYADNFVKEKLLDSHDDKNHWLNYHDLSDRESVEKLCEQLGIDKLTVEDIYSDLKRPKLEEYTNYVFFSVSSALTKDAYSASLKKEKISFIIGKDFLVSFQAKSSDHFTDVRDRIEKRRGKIRMKGPDFLLFRMLEAITDNYFEVLDDIVENIEKIEHKITINPNSELLRRIEIEKRKLIELRKVVFPLKEITSQLDKSESSFIQKENHYYFSNLKDNCLTVLEEIDANKQILEGMANLYYAVQGQKMNQIMKVLTIMSSIFIPLTFIVGVYGMNFEYMPELNSPYGYPAVMAFMALVSIILLLYFKKRGWFKK